MNQPERYEAYVLEPDQTKVTFAKDTKATNAGAFTVRKEDHTLGNVVRMQLLQDPHVVFAGYKVPHPLLNELVVKVRTDGTRTPQEVVVAACNHLLVSSLRIRNAFEDALDMHRRTQAAAHDDFFRPGDERVD